VATPNRCTYLRFNLFGGTRSELFSTRVETISTQQVIPDTTEHSATSSEKEALNN
jgi:hypothetical protein